MLNRLRSLWEEEDMAGWKLIGEFIRDNNNTLEVLDNSYEIPGNATEVLIKFIKPTNYSFSEITVGTTSGSIFQRYTKGLVFSNLTVAYKGITWEESLSSSTIFSYCARIMDNSYLWYSVEHYGSSSGFRYEVVDDCVPLGNEENSLTLKGTVYSYNPIGSGYLVFYR